MQTIIGSGGTIGRELAKELTKYTDKIRLVSRKPTKVNDTDELLAADVLKFDELKAAIKGSEVIYITVGFEYTAKIWAENWPKFIKDTIQICEEENCKIVFFDNVYMYDKDHLNGMTENTVINPPSKKGKVRADIAEMLMEATKASKIKALIARSADFYGPNIEKNCMINETVIKPLNAGKKASLLGKADVKHSFTYTIDAAKATALLGNTESAYNQVWHLPTAANPLTQKEMVDLIAKKMDKNAQIQVAPKFLVRILGLFQPVMKEIVEMVYQYDRDYVFDSSKFEKAFNFQPTSYSDAVESIIESDYKL